jgi:hypothetical protein
METWGAVPVPDKAMVCGLPPALSVMLKVALRAPSLDGVKVRLKLVLAPGATVRGNDDGVKAKSLALAPEIAAAEITRLALPELVTVSATALLEARTC